MLRRRRLVGLVMILATPRDPAGSTGWAALHVLGAHHHFDGDRPAGVDVQDLMVATTMTEPAQRTSRRPTPPSREQRRLAGDFEGYNDGGRQTRRAALAV